MIQSQSKMTDTAARLPESYNTHLMAHDTCTYHGQHMGYSYVSIEEDFDLSDIIEEDEFNINTEIADTEVVEEKINQSLVDVNVEEFQVPDIADEEITIDQ